MAIEIVDFPIENGDFPELRKRLPEGNHDSSHLEIGALGPWVKHVVPEGAYLDPSKGWTFILSLVFILSMENHHFQWENPL